MSVQCSSLSRCHHVVWLQPQLCVRVLPLSPKAGTSTSPQGDNSNGMKYCVTDTQMIKRVDVHMLLRFKR